MDKAEALKIAQKYALEVESKFHYIKIILFGSYAKGDFNDESDIDIAIVFEDYNNLLDMQLELMRLRRKIDSRIEPHPFRKKDFDSSNPLVTEIMTYGQEIIAA
jgi:predicted nucleotidyltransferase